MSTGEIARLPRRKNKLKVADNPAKYLRLERLEQRLAKTILAAYGVSRSKKDSKARPPAWNELIGALNTI